MYSSRGFNHETNLNSNANLAKKLNSEVRKIQAFFHPDIFEQMMQVNNLKGWCDHENGMSEKQTWSSLADLYNSTDPDDGVDIFDRTLPTDKKDHLIDNVGYDAIDLTNFTITPVGGNEIKKYIFGLFKLWAEIKKMNGVSGTHDNDPMLFVDSAKQRVSGGGATHWLALFYFSCKCKDNPRVNDEFCVGMPDNLKRSSTSTEVIDVDADQSVACTAASRTQRSKLQALDTSTAVFQSIAVTLTTKEG
jgi:hypothetical protein